MRNKINSGGDFMACLQAADLRKVFLGSRALLFFSVGLWCSLASSLSARPLSEQTQILPQSAAPLSSLADAGPSLSPLGSPALPLLGSAVAGAGFARSWSHPLASMTRVRLGLLSFFATAGSYFAWRMLTSRQLTLHLQEVESAPALLSVEHAQNSKQEAPERRQKFLDRDPDPDDPQWLLLMGQLDETDEADKMLPPLAYEHRSLDDLIVILDYLPSPELQARVARLTLQGEPALMPEEVGLVHHAYVILELFEKIRRHDQKFFLGNILGFYEKGEQPENISLQKHESLIAMFRDLVRHSMIGKKHKIKSDEASPVVSSAKEKKPLTGKTRSTTKKGHALSLVQLKDRFKKLGESKVMQLVRTSKFFRDVDLNDRVAFPEFGYDALTAYLKKAPKVRQHIFYSEVLGLDKLRPGRLRGRYPTKTLSVRGRTIEQHKDELKAHLLRYFKAPVPQQRSPFSFAELEQRYRELSATDVMQRVRTSAFFGSVDLGDASIFPDFRYDVLTAYLEVASVVERHLFYSYILGFDERMNVDIARSLSLSNKQVSVSKRNLHVALMQLFLALKNPEDRAHYLDKLEDRFKDLSASEVMRRVQWWEFFKDINLSEEAAFPYFSYETLIDFLQNISYTERSIFYNIVMGLDGKGNNLDTIAAQYSLRTSGSYYLKYRLSQDLSRLFRKGPQKRALSLDASEKVFTDLSEAEAMDLVRQSDCFAAVDFSDVAAFPVFRYDVLTAYLQQASEIKKRVFYSLMMKLDGTRYADIAEHYSISSSLLTYYKKSLCSDLLQYFSDPLSAKHMFYFSELEQLYRQMSSAEVMQRVQRSDFFGGVDLSDQQTFPEFRYNVLTDFLGRQPEVKRFMFYRFAMDLDDSNMESIAGQYALALPSATRYINELRATFLRIFSGRKAVSFAQIKQQFEGLNAAEVMTVLRTSGFFGDVDLSDRESFPHFSYDILTAYLQQEQQAMQHIFYVFVMNLGSAGAQKLADYYAITPRSIYHKRKLLKSELLKWFITGNSSAVILSFGELEQKFGELSEDKVMNIVRTSAFFSDVNLSDDVDFPHFSYDSLSMVMEREKEIRKHILYSLIMKLDHGKISDIARKHLISEALVGYHRRELRKKLLLKFSEGEG